MKMDADFCQLSFVLTSHFVLLEILPLPLTHNPSEKCQV